MKKFAKYRKYPGGGMIPYGQAGALGQQIGTDLSTNEDGSVNKNGYSISKGIGMAGQGAALGSFAGPVGTAVGAGLGFGAGVLLANREADQINDQVSQRKIDEEKRKRELEDQENELKAQQQEMYNRAYNSMYSSSGNVGATLYAKGGLMCYPDGGKMPYGTSVVKTPYVSPSDWDKQNLDAGYLYSGFGKDYKEYYNPKEYTKDENGAFVKLGDLGKIVDYKSDPTYQPFIKYQGVATAQNSKPVVIPTSNRKAVDFQYANQGITGYTYDDGTTKYIDGTGNEVNWDSYKKAYGGTIDVPGGKLTKLADDTVKADGNTHSQGGIKLQAEGQSFAEIEDQEIVKDNKVYSDRLKVDGKTYANIAEKLGKQKGKFEKMISSDNNRTRNTGERMTTNLDMELEGLFNHQEMSKMINNPEQKFPYGGDLSTAAQYAIPLIDNLYNASLIRKTPQVPLPTNKQAYYATAMPMKTEYNIDVPLSQANDDYRNFINNIDENTSSSQVGRANKLAAFSAKLKANNQLYSTKENTETQLRNANSANMQNINNINTKNSQDINNQNLAATDNYNTMNMYRSDDILKRNSANVSNAVSDTQRMIQDMNMKDTDEQRIMTDALKYNDGAGFSRLLGSKTLGNLISSDPKYYSQVEQSLIKGGQNDALEQFYKLYGRKSQAPKYATPEYLPQRYSNLPINSNEPELVYN